MFKNAPDKVLKMLFLLFYVILKTGQFPEHWCKGLITPVYKKGDKLNPHNYRGISVANALLKVFCLIMNKRLQDYITEEKMTKDKLVLFQNAQQQTIYLHRKHSLISMCGI